MASDVAIIEPLEDNTMPEAVGEAIFKQLGGYKFIAMTGANNLISDNKGLGFHIGRNAKGVTHVCITLEPSDTYKMEFLKVRQAQIKTVAVVEGVYFDMLQDIFTEHTGLDTHL